MSMKSLEQLIDQYTIDIGHLDPQSATTESALIVSDLTIRKISNDLVQLQTSINQKHNKSIDSKFNNLQYLVDTTRYAINKKRNNISTIQSAAETDPASDNVNTNDNDNMKSKSTTSSTGVNTIHDSEDITSLRKRLLTTSSIVPQQQVNAYHENLQQDLINDLSTLASDLKSGAYNLSMKILDDNNLLSKTSEGLMKNNSLMDAVGDNLNSYVMNKSGGKISFWFLLKALGFILSLFLAMIIIIKLFPKL